MNLIVHRGTRQIGGSCVEVQSGADRVLLDLGLPLPNGKDDVPISGQTQEALLAEGVLPRINGVYAGSTPEVRAVIMSHVHPDHIGLGPYVHPDIPVHATEGTWALHDVMRIFGPKSQDIINRRTLPKQTPVSFGALTVTAIPVDHSAPDAVALLVEADGKRLLYSGDLRAHGRKSYLWNRLKDSDLKGTIDLLLLEGTTIGRPAGEVITEQSLEPKLLQLLEHQKNLALIFCSAQNLDRIVTIYRAVKRTGKIMVIDLYTAYTLDALRCLSPNLPQWDWPQIRVIQWGYQQGRLKAAGKESFIEATKKNAIGWKGLKARKSEIVFLLRANFKVAELEKKFGAEVAEMQVIWSMWDGYWAEDRYVHPLCERHGIERSTLHTSGHAAWQDLKGFAEALQPKAIVPIHTAHAGDYGRDLANVRLLSDGELLAV